MHLRKWRVVKGSAKESLISSTPPGSGVNLTKFTPRYHSTDLEISSEVLL